MSSWTLFYGTLLLGLSLAWRPYEIRDADVFWHLATGRWMLEHRAITRTDPFSFTAPGAWVNHEWLFQVLWRTIQAAGGIWLLYASKALLYTLALALPAWWAIRRGFSSGAVLFGCGLALFAGLPFSEYRPLAVSIVLFACACEAGERISKRSRHLWWWLPLLFAVWSNLHATFPLGFAAIGVYAVFAALKRQVQWRKAASFVGLSAAATLLNPYLWEVWLVPAKVAGSRLFMEANQEWRPPDLSAEFLGFYVCAGALVLGLLASYRRALTPSVALALLLAAASIKSRRMIPYFAVAAIPALAMLASDLLPRMRPQGILVSRLLLCALTPLALWWGYGVYRLPGNVVHTEDRLPFLNGAFPLPCVQTLLSTGDKGNLFNDYNHGGFLHYTAGPGWKVYIDGRNDLFGASHTWRYHQLALGDSQWRETFLQKGVPAALISYDTAMHRPNLALELASSPSEWLLANFDDAGMLFLRRNTVAAAWAATHEYQHVKPMLLYEEQREVAPAGTLPQFVAELRRRVDEDRCRIAELLLCEALYDSGSHAESQSLLQRITEHFGEDSETLRLRKRLAQSPIEGTWK